MSALTPEEQQEASRWLGGAEDELRVARVLAEHEEVPNRAACFHTRLAVEKALEALLIMSGVEVPRSHDLGELKALVPLERGRLIDDADLMVLNPWTIDGGYPGDVADVSTAEVRGLLEAALCVVAVVREASSGGTGDEPHGEDG